MPPRVLGLSDFVSPRSPPDFSRAIARGLGGGKKEDTGRNALAQAQAEKVGVETRSLEQELINRQVAQESFGDLMNPDMSPEGKTNARRVLNTLGPKVREDLAFFDEQERVREKHGRDKIRELFKPAARNLDTSSIEGLMAGWPAFINVAGTSLGEGLKEDAMPLLADLNSVNTQMERAIASGDENQLNAVLQQADNWKSGLLFEEQQPQSQIGKIARDIVTRPPEERQIIERIQAERDRKPGEIIETTPEGGVRIVRGPGVGQGGARTIGKGATTAIEKELVSIRKQKSSAILLKNAFDPGILTLMGRVRNKFTSFASFIGLSNEQIGSENIKHLRKARRLNQTIEVVFNEYRRHVTGAAASVQEIQGLKESMLSRDLSPEEFKIALKTYTNSLERAELILVVLLREGVNPKTKAGTERYNEIWSRTTNVAAERGFELMKQGFSEGEATRMLALEGFELEEE